MYLKRITSIFSIIMIFMFTIGQSLLPIVANAQELNTAGIVDSFKIDKTDLYVGQRTKVTVNFSEKDGSKLKPGDTLTLTLPPELKGLNTEFLLDDYGTCKVTAGTVVCTFNDKVSTHQNIKGYLNFFIEAANVGTDEKKEIETNFGTNVDKQSVTITGPSSGGGTDPGKPPFFYKTGDMNSGKSDEVRWFLNINLAKEELSRDIVVTDNLQEGQTLNKDSFYIIVDDHIGRRSLTLQELEKQGYGTITFTGDKSFKVVLNKDKARLASFSIGYTSTITEAGKKQDFFKNDYTIDYQVLNGEPVTESGTHPVENMTAGGGAEGNVTPRGTLKIVKHIEGDEEKVIPNVSFKLYKEPNEQVGDVYTTDEKGIIEIPNLQPGKYYVKEVSAPDYIDFDPQAKVNFEVKSDAVNGVKLLIPNKVKTTSIAGTKTWKDDNEKDRPSSIKVDLLQNGKVVDTKEVTAADGWKYKFDNLTVYDANGVAYKYEVKEQPIDGYTTEVNGYDITNTKVVQTTKVEGTKTWKDGNAEGRPTMIKVDLLQNGKVIATQEVSEATGWKYEFKDLAINDADGKAYKYEVKEQAVPGYESKVNGYDITNTKVGKTSVAGTKTWKGGTEEEHKAIKVDLLQNGTVIATQEVSKETGWKYEFKDLVAFDENGKAYKYEVKEQPVDGYESKVNGYDITNTKVGKTSVAGTKTWNDNNASDRPKTIKVDLVQKDNSQAQKETLIATQEVSEATGWKYEFKDLAAYDAEGKAYKYEVKEQAVPGYESKVNGYDITNTKVGKTSVAGTKTWKGGTEEEHKAIKVDLLQNGTVIATQEVSKETGWKYEFKDLVAFDENGKAYKYEVKEQPVDGYESKVNGYDITNTKVGKTSVAGTKTWNDNNASDRPKTIKVDLVQKDNSQAQKETLIATQEVSEATGWKYEFKDLAAYDAEGKAYKYEVKEQAVPGYESKVNGYDITNTKVGETKVEGTKTWKDDNAKDRPEMIKVDLLQNGKVVETKEVTAETNWKYTFEKLQAYDAEGKAYKYEVKEQAIPGYESKVKGYDITNTKVGETKVEGTKTWKDDNAKDRPEMIKVDLLQNGKVVDTKEVTAETNWKYTFEKLQAYDANGAAYKYEVKEQAIPGYESKVNGTDITNTKVGKTKVEGTKTWKDDNATDRPEMIKVDLLQNGTVIATQEVSKATGWKYEFKDLAAYDAEGKAYKYEVKEQAVEGYKSKVNGYDITNTKVGETKVEGTKTWNDNNATDRPSTIKVDLLQNGKVVETKEVTAETNWKYTFEKLQAYDANGAAYKYEVKEQAIPGYESKVNGTDITNTKVGKTKVEGTKTWKDGNATDRPTMIKVDLLQNGNVIQTHDVLAVMGWKYIFADLEAYDAEGKAYEYTVKEQPVPGYESKVSGTDITNTKVGQTKVEGTKTWKDDNATDRPEMIKVDLLQNGTVIATQEVSKATGWKYEFKDLAAYDAEGKAYKYEVKEQAVPGYESKVNGYDITNTKVGETKVEGTKTWKDDNAKDRPEMIKVDLLQNGKVVDTKEVTAVTNWKYTFEKLQAYDANGVAYKYEVKEQAIPGYESKVNGTDITNTKVGKTKVEGTKTWKDDNAKDRPEMIKVDLLQNGTVIATQEVSKVTGWKYEFKDLAAYDENGVAYKYEVKEQAVAGYESKVNGTDITNTKVGETKVEGTKTWKDDNATNRPSTIKVDLLQNGKVVDTKEVTAETNWKYTFEKLQAYDENGVAYKYEVKEQPVAGYKSEVKGYDITNTKVAELTVEGTKTWNDNNATDRPSSIKVDLLQNGKVVDIKEVTAATNWKYTFEKLQAYDENGVAYKYEVKEQPVAGYQSDVHGYDITNTKVGETKVEGTKTWNDNNATDRPSTIKVDLLQNGKVVETKEVTAETNWKYMFEKLQAYDAAGKAYKYEVKEQAVEGYKSKVNGYDITNTKVGETKVEGTKTWNDNNTTDRPSTIKVDLLQNGKVVDTKEVTVETHWKYMFEKLQAYDANGVAYKYEVKEQAVPGYESKVNGYDITNTKVGKTKVEGTKTWKDDNATDRPEMIKVDLLQNGTVIATQEVSKATGWKYEFKDLAAYDAEGKAYKYEVKEQTVPGYESKVSGTDITNTKVGETKVEGTKTWNDNNATDRPSTIKVDLLQNGKVVDTKEVTVETNWKYTFEKLQAYDAEGKAYKYEVKEQAVEGYKSKVNGYDITNTKVGETKVEGTKTWKDDNATDRPSTIKVDLLQNGKVVDTKEVTAETNWKYTFEKLQAYDANGAAYKYEVKEQAIPGYESKVNGTDITNTKVGKTKVEGTKTWKDDNTTDRPEMIKVDLLQNGTVIATQEVSKATGWKYEFKDLAAYDANGVAYKYEVKEQPVAGYESKVSGTDITNTKVGETKVEGTKTWSDNNATDRPSSIKVDLLQNGKVVDTKEVTAETNWKYTFEKLQAYDANGVAYKYEVKEQPVAGYKSEVKGYDITNTKIKDKPNVDPKDPSTDPKDPSTDPKDPSTDPKDPSTDPKNPNTNTGSNSDSKVPSTTENDKPTLLPNTGGTSAGMSSILGGMVLFLLGGILFARQRIK
ncbi:cell wall anchor protein [Bacillus thuringiensis]|nr:Cna B-type domain-containing protein [Bacillus sp. CRB-7]ALL21689.1 cell wall anchor protein [Bacillus thuringiensis]UBM48177.1 Cna B-type domain-containing protein [Bacillus sp. CRB-7]